jgi:hypothetical protein
MRTAALYGREHPRLGAISAIAEGRAAVALSRGGAKKTYAHKHPNEDACAFATTSDATLLVVADGHAGFEASQLAVERVIERHAPRWMAPTVIEAASRFELEAADVMFDVHQAIVALVGSDSMHPPRTTLSIALMRRADDLFAWMSIGDSHVFELRERLSEHGRPGDAITYLGTPGVDRAAIEGRFRVGVGALGGTRAVVLATDGLSERGIGVADPVGAGASALAQAESAGDPQRIPLVAARGLAERALGAHRAQRAGDNIATAVAWLD